MRSYRFSPCVLLLFSFLASSARFAHAEEAAEWLRGAGKDLEIRLAGEMLDADGRPATDVALSGALNHQVSPLALEPKVEGNRFEVWIPVNRTHWYSMWLAARSKNGGIASYLTLNTFRLRQAAIEGVTLKLQPPARYVDAQVTYEGKPVADAHVKAEAGYGVEIEARTGANGVARIGVPAGRELSRLMAWTEDHRIGGYQFDRTPSRDPEASSQVVELSQGVDRTIRLVDQEGLPVPGIDFILHFASPPPDYNFVGTNEHSRMTSDANGEAVYRWFPDWQTSLLYIEIDSANYYVERDSKVREDAVIFTLKRCKARKTVAGRIELAEDATHAGLGGFYARLDTFQAEREDTVDQLWTFTNPDGTFEVDVLPSATYCGHVLDERWVGELIDLIPYQPAIDRVTTPVLKVFNGEPVEVVVTKGGEKKPYSDLTISFRRYHSFEWVEDGEVRGGMGGPQWWATTDDAGKAATRSLPGEMEVSIYTPIWRTERKLKIAKGEGARIELHRGIEDEREVSGRLVLADGVESAVEGAEIVVGSLDGEYEFEQRLAADADGEFRVETVAAKIGVFAYAKDGKSAGYAVTEQPGEPIKLELRPTQEFHGMLVDGSDRPLSRHRVFADVRMEGEKIPNAFVAKIVDAKRLETKTDELGGFSFSGVPSGLEVVFFADPLPGSSRSEYLGDAHLQPDDSRPPTVFRIGKQVKVEATTPLAERYEKAVRDARLGGYHVMAILSTPGDHVAEFVENNFVDYRKNETVSAYMQLVVQPSKSDQEAADMLFLEERDWQLPEHGQVLAMALDASGEELGRVEVGVSDEDAAEQAAEFVRKHAPAKVDAKKKWDEAFAEARSSNRRVWARVSGRYCGPCFSMARWLDDHHQLLAKDYVMVKIDEDQTSGREVAERLTVEKQHGVPFHAIFDADEKLLIDSVGPLGNIGHPSRVEGKRHLRKMLSETRQKLTDEEIERLVESLED